MKKLNIMFSLGIMLFALTGCGGGGGGGSNVSLEFKIGAILDPTTVQGGGMMFAHNITTNSKFAWIIPAGSTTYERNMANGSWTYDVMIWAGPDPLTGQVRCGSTTADLTGSTVTAALTLSAANCSDEYSNLAMTQVTDGSGGTLLPLRLVSCSYLTQIPNANSTCDDPFTMRGRGLSFKVELVEHAAGAPTGAITSSCVTHQGHYKMPTTKSTFLTGLRLPAAGSKVNPFIRIVSYEDTACTKLIRSYDFPEGFANAATLRTGDIYRSSAGNEAAVRRTNDPYATTYYSASSNSDYAVTEVKYVNTSNSQGCNCSALTGVTCNQDTDTDAAASDFTCPSATNGVSRTGPFMPYVAENTCISDFSAQNGPNCDSGAIVFRRIVCQGDGSASPAVCSLMASSTINCSGEGYSTCRYGNSAPNYLSVYIADTHSAVGDTPFAANVPDFSCGGQDCLKNWVDPPMGTGSGSGQLGNRQDYRQLAGEVFGLPEGKNPWSDNQGYCYPSNYIGGSGTGTGGGYYVSWYSPFPNEVVSCGSGYGSSDDDDYLDKGTVGEIVEWLQGDGIGGLLFKHGYTTCASIPTSGTLSFSVVEGPDTFNGTLYFSLGDRNFPNFSSSPSSFFEKKIVLEGTDNNEIMEMEYQFNCTSDLTVGYLRTGHDETRDGLLEKNREEIYFSGSGLGTLESRSYSERGSDVFRNRVRMQKMAGSEFAVWSTNLSRSSYSYYGSGSGSGSGTGGGSNNWYASNATLYGNMNDGKIIKFGTSRGDITVSTNPSMNNGSVTIQGTDPNQNGIAFNFIGSPDMQFVTVNAIGTSQFDINYDNAPGPTYTQHTCQDVALALQGALGGGFNVINNCGTSPFGSNGFFHLTGGVLANSILPVSASGNIYDLIFSGSGNLNSILYPSQTYVLSGNGTKFTIVGQNGGTYHAVLDGASTTGTVAYFGALDDIGGISVSAGSVNSSLSVCAYYPSASGSCGSPEPPTTKPTQLQFSNKFDPDDLLNIGLGSFPGP